MRTLLITFIFMLIIGCMIIGWSLTIEGKITTPQFLFMYGIATLITYLLLKIYLVFYGY